MIDQGPDAGNSSTGLTSDKTSSVAHLSSAVLDSLLCILVDSSPALRTFEEVNGVQAIVKILKRAGTPREVSTDLSVNTVLADIHPTKYTFTEARTKNLPSSAFGYFKSINYIFVIIFVINRLIYIVVLDLVHIVVKKSYSASALPPDPHTPPGSPPPGSDFAKPMTRAVQSRSMFLLRKEVDYEPQSPKKIQISSLGVGGGHSASRLRDRATGRSEHSGGSSSSLRQVDVADNSGADYERGGSKHERVRTTDEKKEILGTMLGNVDALVEGVRRAGIWGLS
ncbi:hypothetical protein ID866_8739 [Astraeus odoratus]|nr:hypothetical protein ID866_8739 [Astraeus odoratus]